MVVKNIHLLLLRTFIVHCIYIREIFLKTWYVINKYFKILLSPSKVEKVYSLGSNPFSWTMYLFLIQNIMTFLLLKTHKCSKNTHMYFPDKCMKSEFWSFIQWKSMNNPKFSFLFPFFARRTTEPHEKLFCPFLTF